MQVLDELKKEFPHSGQVEWIGIRERKNESVVEVEQVTAIADRGLAGDKAGSRPGGKRQVTLIQWEYISVIQALLPESDVSAAILRRNIAISGINLNALKEQTILIGGATLAITGFCHPCSKLADQLGPGAYNAMRGHGGLTAKVSTGGIISLGDSVSVIDDHHD